MTKEIHKGRSIWQIERKKGHQRAKGADTKKSIEQERRVSHAREKRITYEQKKRRRKRYMTAQERTEI